MYRLYKKTTNKKKQNKQKTHAIIIYTTTKTKELRNAWVKKFVDFNSQNEEKKKSDEDSEEEEKVVVLDINFQTFFTSFWKFLPEWPQ